MLIEYLVLNLLGLMFGQSSRLNLKSSKLSPIYDNNSRAGSPKALAGKYVSLYLGAMLQEWNHNHASMFLTEIITMRCATTALGN